MSRGERPVTNTNRYMRQTNEKQTVNEPLPDESNMTRADALDAFVAVINEVKPKHPYHSRDSIYPITSNNVDYGVTRNYYARCGPRSSPREPILYKTRLTYINNITRERHLALITHELTHVSADVNNTFQHGVHPPKFWREMAYHALLVRDSLQDGHLATIFPNVNVNDFLTAITEDPNSSVVDRRYWTVEECKQELRDLVDISKQS